jgi:Ca-activated chloride channel family protein
MHGSKLDYAKRSITKLIDHLGPGDYAGLVTFESEVRTHVRPVEITEATKNRLRTEVSKLHSMGGTNFAGGLLEAIDVIKKLDLPNGVLLRVIMFTDGQANEGIATKPEELLKLLKANMGRVTVSAFGYGDGGGIDQDFLNAFATEGKGNYAYIKDPDAALTAFGRELGGLLSTYATDLVLEIKPLAGHQITEVVSDVDVEEAVTGEVTIKVSDILAQETRNIVLDVKLAEQKQALPRPVNLFEVNLTYAKLGENATKDTATADVKVKAQFVKNGEESASDRDLDQIVALAQLAKAQTEAEELAKAGNYGAAQGVLRSMAAHANGLGFANIGLQASRLEARVADAGTYAKSAGYLNTSRRAMTRAVGVACYDASASEDIAELGLVSSNSLQESLVESFTSNTVQPDAEPAPWLSSGGDAPSVFQPAVVTPPEAPSPEEAPVKKSLTKKRSTPRW